MNEREYQERVEALWLAVEDALDEADAELDYEVSGSLLTILCEDTDTQVIISRQPAVAEVWVAAKSGGFHCGWRPDIGAWYCNTTSEEFWVLLQRVVSEQSSGPVRLQA